MANTKLLKTFASSPIEYDIPVGMALPPQMKREIHVDPTKKKLRIKIEEAMGQAFTMKKKSRKPHGDLLVPTYDLMLSLDNALKMLFPVVGILRFKESDPRRSFVKGGKGKYVWVGSVGRWQVHIEDASGDIKRLWLIPDPEEWGADPPVVLCLTADQAPDNFRMYVQITFHDDIRSVYFPDLNHVEHNVDGGLLEAQNLSFLDAKSRHLCKLHHGPKKSEGHFHGQIKEAFQVGSSQLT